MRPQAVVADYAASGERTGALIARLRRSPTYAPDIDSKPADSHRVRPETMAAFLEQMDARHGGAARWLADHGFSPDDLHLLRAKLRDQAPPAGLRRHGLFHMMGARYNRSATLPT